MGRLWQQIAGFMAADGRAALITLAEVQGSSPREAGTFMAMRADGRFTGTIGGGTLEWQALAEAQKLLKVEGGQGVRLPFALGPSLGQCCGGRVVLRIEAFAQEDAAWINALAAAEAATEAHHLPLTTQGSADSRGVYVRSPVPASWPSLSRPSTTFPTREGTSQVVDARDERGHDGTVELVETFGETLAPLLLFGAGHVGRALVLALAPLPFSIRWVDPRAGEFPAAMPGNVTPLAPQNPEAELATAPSNSMVLVMTHSHASSPAPCCLMAHSHALDLALCAAALNRDDLAFIGVIGSATKRARFMSQLEATGLGEAARTRLNCPIGLPGLVAGKHPAIIAASVAVQLLQARERTLVLPHSQEQSYAQL
jgi:xanthine dehydrogenase accessory factor